MEIIKNSATQETRNVVGLGIVSFFNDLSSEVVARVLPLYLLTVIKTSLIGIGFVEAIAEGTAVFAKLFAGVYSDRISRRKSFVFVGYALSVISRPLILMTPSVVIIGMSRFIDKVGKGVRTAPRDALVADLSNAQNRGFHFGITRSLDTLGAVLGLASVAFYLTYHPMSDGLALKLILIAASVAGVFALIALWLGVREPAAKTPIKKEPVLFNFTALDKRLQFYLVAAFFFALASSSDAFLVVRAKEFGFSIRDIFVILTGFNIVSTIAAYQLSKLSDRWGRKWMLIGGWLIYFYAYIIFGLPGLSPFAFVSTIVIYGLFYGLTEGVEKALIADFEFENHKGFAFGSLGLVNGLGVIPANLLFAYLYRQNGATPAFWMSASFALVGIGVLAGLKTAKRHCAI